MALSSDIQWEWRPNGNIRNGGGFRSSSTGTDYTLQAAAQWTAADLYVLPTSTNINSSSSNFTSDIIGNIISIVSGAGFTVGSYEIVDWIDSKNLVIDRVCNSTTTNSGLFYIGGAFYVGSSSEDARFEAATSGNNIWFWNGTSTNSAVYTLSAAVTISTAGGTQQPIKVKGYNTTRGDNPTGNSRPTIANGASALTLGSNFDVYNLQFTGTGTSVLTTGSANKIVNCKFTNQSSTADRNAINVNNTDVYVFNNEIVSYRGRGIHNAISNSTCQYIANYIHDSNIGINVATTTSLRGNTILNLIESNVTSAINIGSADVTAHFIGYNTLYGSENTTGVGINLATGTTDTRILNNIIYGFTTGTNHADTQTVGYDDYNDYFNNDVNVVRWTTTGTNNQYVDPTFTSVGQVTGTNAGFFAAGSKMYDTATNFVTAGVVAGQDCVYIVSGTGVTAGQYLIDSISTTSNTNDTLNITIPASPGTSLLLDKVYQITTGRNFGIGTNLKALGFPGAFQGALTTGYMDIGAVQRQEPASSGGSSWYSGE